MHLERGARTAEHERLRRVLHSEKRMRGLVETLSNCPERKKGDFDGTKGQIGGGTVARFKRRKEVYFEPSLSLGGGSKKRGGGQPWTLTALVKEPVRSRASKKCREEGDY